MSRKNKNKVRLPLPPGVTRKEAVKMLRDMGPEATLLDAARVVVQEKERAGIMEVTQEELPDPKAVIS